MELKIFMSLNAITMTAPRGDEISAQFFADIGDVNIQKVGHRAFVLIEQVLVKLRARDDFAAMKGEKFHQQIFPGREFNRLALE